ncbi:MAG: SCP2 sterol-binding domain-containing protein [Woeseia sp.]
MNALERLLQPVARLANRQIRMKTPARELCGELEGSVVAVRVRDTALAMYFHVHDGELALSSEFDGVPDAVISGSLLTLAQMAGQSGDAAVRDGSLELTGDAQLAQSFQRLLWHARPDVEEELSAVIGDVAAHGLGDMARSLGNWTRNAGATLRQNLSEYLQEESRSVPSRNEVEHFRAGVEKIRDDVARFEARLSQLEEKPGTGRAPSRQ